MSARFPADPALPEVLSAFGLTSSALLGSGGEATVCALDSQRVLRIHRPGPERAALERRAKLLDELAERSAELPFALPRVLDVQRVRERWVSLETRLEGQPLDAVLARASGSEREALLLSYLGCGARLCRVPWSGSSYGDLLADDGIRTGSFREYLEQRARRSLALAGEPFRGVDATALAAALPQATQPAFVYLDYYPSNVLVDLGRVTAVVDFGGSVIAGESSFGSVVAATYLTPRDEPLARAWLEREELTELYQPTRRWIAAFWSFARDDATLFAWCRSVLAP